MEDFQRRIRHLEEENAYLRESARTFGDLAERLKKALDAERVKQAGQRADRLLS
jgi:signal transduction protein with GAF and PtsI domain